MDDYFGQHLEEHQNCSLPEGGDLQKWLTSAKECDVLVVGGGVSGLSATRKLIQDGLSNVIPLEAQERVGGRVSTYREGDIVVEDGAQWIHGDIINPLHKIANSLNAVQEELPDNFWGTKVIDASTGKHMNMNTLDLVETILYETYENGTLVPYYHTGYGQYFIDKFPNIYGDSWGDSISCAWMHYLEKRINNEEGTDAWLDISARDADQYIDLGEDYEWKNGYDTLINYLMKDIPSEAILLGSPVSKIFWDLLLSNEQKDQVLVVTDKGNSYLAKKVIITVSVGVLKRRHQCIFSPLLPMELTDAFKGIELGSPNKIFIGWDSPWWGNKLFDSHVLWTNRNLSNEMSWLYGISNIFSTNNKKPILQMFISGIYSRQMEDLTENDVKKHVLFLFSRITSIKVPEPTFFRRSKWYNNPWTYGSYSSYITINGDNSGIHSRAPFRKPIQNSAGKSVLQWAGEHTSDGRYGTVDGAMVSGEREADNILALRHPNNINLSSLNL